MKKKKLAILIVLFLTLLIGGSFAVYRLKHRDPSYTATGNTSSKNTTKRTTSLPSSKTTTGTSSTNQVGNSVAISDVTPPANNASYPIVNDHYRIDNTSGNHFDITLYAIINSPSQYDEYQAQLKQYKQEALSYLTSRYGSVSQFTFTWDPPAAKDL